MARAVLLATWLGLSPCAFAGSALPQYEGQGVTVRLSPRTAEQVSAFYAARGFPDNAVRLLAASCVVTVTVVNRRQDTLWLELGRWRFVDAQGRELERLDRVHWNGRWERLALPPANRATFGWTQLPEVRDLYPGEPVGGNVVLAPFTAPFRLEARFATGRDKRGPEVVVVLDGLSCATGERAP
jgi:hypothetical protein